MTDQSRKRYGGVITRRTGNVAGGSGDPTQILYEWVVTDPGVSMKSNGPTLPTRRISVGAKVVPAEENDPCEIVVVNGKLFLHVIEGIKFREACT